MSDELTRVTAALEALGDDATPEQVAEAIRGYSKRDIAAAMFSLTDGGGGGGSLPDEWTIGADGQLQILSDGVGPLLDVRSTDGSFVFASPTAGIQLSADPGAGESALNITPNALTFEDENNVVQIDVQGGYINLGNGGKFAAGETDVYVAGPTDTLGFYGGAGVAKQTGVAVTAEAIHAALVNLGLISGP